MPKERAIRMGLPAGLADAIEEVGKRRSVAVGFDTHYDAGNGLMTWWGGKSLYGLDFQPVSDGSIAVTLWRTDFPVWPRVLAWACSNVPMFPRVARETRKRLQDLTTEEPNDGWLGVVTALTDAALRMSRHRGVGPA